MARFWPTDSASGKAAVGSEKDKDREQGRGIIPVALTNCIDDRDGSVAIIIWGGVRFEPRVTDSA